MSLNSMTTTGYDPSCVICGQRVRPGEPVYRQVVGFVRPRRQGGTNALRLREATGRVAHAACVRNGEVRGQETLL